MKNKRKDFLCNIRELKINKFKKYNSNITYKINKRYILFKTNSISLEVAVDIGKYILSNSNDRDTLEELNNLCANKDNERIVEFLEEMYLYTDRFQNIIYNSYLKEEREDKRINKIEIENNLLLDKDIDIKPTKIDIVKNLGLEEIYDLCGLN